MNTPEEKESNTAATEDMIGRIHASKIKFADRLNHAEEILAKLPNDLKKFDPQPK